jgi:hypothetical protein
MNDLPWYHETAGPHYVNEWTWTHVVWGSILYRMTGSVAGALAWHTVYEMIEGQLFPSENRDTSMENHIGDSIASLIGSFVARER